MKKDVETLKNLNQEAKERCIESESDKSHMQEESLNRPWSPDVIAYTTRKGVLKSDIHDRLHKQMYKLPCRCIGSSAHVV